MNSIEIGLVTITCDCNFVGSLGNTRYYKLRDQFIGEGPIRVLLPIELNGANVAGNVYKDIDAVTGEYWLIPDNIAMRDDKVIPESEKSVRDWYINKFWTDWSINGGDIRGLVLELEGIDIHGKIEHNGEALYSMIQAKYPSQYVPKFNAAQQSVVTMDRCCHEGEEDVYIIKNT